jgi:tRNA A58 N-methylase Trm61
MSRHRHEAGIVGPSVFVEVGNGSGMITIMLLLAALMDLTTHAVSLKLPLPVS